MAKKKGGVRKGAGRKPLYGDQMTTQVGLSLPEEMLAQIEDLEGIRQGRSRSEVIVSLIWAILNDEDYNLDVVSQKKYPDL